MPVLTLAKAKSQLKIPVANTAHDDELTEYVDGVNEVVEYYIGPVDNREVVERWSGWLETIAVRHTPVVEVVEVVYLDDTLAVDVDDIDVDTVTGELRRISACRWPTGMLKVTYTTGRGGVAPHSAVVAGLMIIQHLWEVRRGADARRPNFSPVENNTVQVSTSGGFTFSVPRRAVQLLEAHMTGPAAA